MLVFGRTGISPLGPPELDSEPITNNLNGFVWIFDKVRTPLTIVQNIVQLLCVSVALLPVQ